MIETQVPAQLLKGLALIPELDLANVLDRAAYLPGADIVEAILDGRQPKGFRLAEMLGNGPLAWEEQRTSWILAPS
jgi:hypothetical protein